jgi:hypothetical protein
MRRKHLLTFIAIIAILCPAGLSKANFEARDNYPIQENGNFIARSVIGCVIGEVDLEKIIENVSHRQAYDIIVIPSFHDHRHKKCSAFLIDRHLIGKAIWKEYLDFITKSEFETPIVLVDDIQDWIRPENDSIAWLDPKDEGLTSAMVMKLDFIRIRDSISFRISRLISH